MADDVGGVAVIRRAVGGLDRVVQARTESRLVGRVPPQRVVPHARGEALRRGVLSGEWIGVSISRDGDPEERPLLAHVAVRPLGLDRDGGAWPIDST